MTLSLPIPGKKEKIKFFYIPYNMNIPDYSNFSGDVLVRESDFITDFRNEVYYKYKIDIGSYLVTGVSDNNFKRILSLK